MNLKKQIPVLCLKLISPMEKNNQLYIPLLDFDFCGEDDLLDKLNDEKNILEIFHYVDTNPLTGLSTKEFDSGVMYLNPLYKYTEEINYNILKGSDGIVRLFGTKEFEFSNLIKNNIFVVYISDTDMKFGEVTEDFVECLDQKLSKYIGYKYFKHRTFYNWTNPIQTIYPLQTIIETIMIPNLIKEISLIDKVSFLVVYDNVKMETIVKTEKIVKDFSMYYGSILMTENIAFRVNIISDVESQKTINLTQLKEVDDVSVKIDL